MKTQQLSTIVLLFWLCSSSNAAAQFAAPAAKPLPPAAAAAPVASSVSSPAEGKPDKKAGQPAGEKAKSQSAEDKKKAEEKKKKAEEAAKKQARMQKIQEVQFDRRTSTILKVWAEPEVKSEDDKKKDEEQPKQEPPEKPGEKKPEPDPFDVELKGFQRDVTLGNWVEVGRYLSGLPEDEGKTLYLRLLQGLQAIPKGIPADVPPEVRQQLEQLQQMRARQQGGKRPEKNTFNFDDVIALAEVAPVELDENIIRSLGAIVRLALEGGNVVEELVTRLKAEAAKPKKEAALDCRQIAQVLIAARQTIEAGEFLPKVEQAKAEGDFEGLNLLSQYLLAVHAKEKELGHLEQAWEVTQAVLASDKTKKEERDKALKRAVDLAPKIREELGQAWLEESFTGQPQRGMEILASIGAAASQGLHSQADDPHQRLIGLKLQTTAVEALLKSSPEQAGRWRDTLNLLAGNWLKEATMTYQHDQSTSRGPRLQRDPFGNYFYYEDGMSMSSPHRSGGFQAIKTGDMLEIKPSDAWLAMVEGSLKPKFDKVFAQLYLKVGEEDNAFPHIERLATVYPDIGKTLVDEFLRVWTQNHDPNTNRNRTNYYMFMYGFERRAESIPLTRSKQQRNLKELAELVKRLRALPLEELNEELLAQAFTTCHSSAEVYRLEAIETVFGAMENLEPKTLAELAQQMRTNLIGVWRKPSEQKDKNTKRKQKDIQAEVLRGYGVAKAVIERGLEKHPDHWALTLAQAAIEHDENNYRKEISPDSKFSEKRDDAFAGFRKAAEQYAAGVEDLREDEETTRAYELWYYASLGACDLKHISEEVVPDLRQPKLIREAILSLPGEAAERHLAMFANTLFTRMSAVKPAGKFRYLRTGLEIVGDHKQAREARKVFDYYKDLVTEIKLETAVDGSDVVGHTEPFGVFVNLQHTREIERESGGFGRYLQNQNAGSHYYYNYGRPLENYRDKFAEIVRQALEEHFEILSVTFQTENVNSKALPEYGWRVTPYAYLLLKARGPEVDKIPPVRLDLDFLDTSGYAVIPVESPALPIDASPKKAEARPLQKLNITQTLDERQADEGKLILEIKATAQGLVPELDNILDLAPKGFDIISTEDQGLSVSRFDPESDETLVVSERSWMVHMQAEEDLTELPKSFQFGQAKLDTNEVVYQRYDDADLVAVDREISLEEEYGETSHPWLWAGLIGLFAIVVLVPVVLRIVRRKPETKRAPFEIPAHITPFTVLGLLRQIQQNNGLSNDGKQELAASIDRLEQHYFLRRDDEEPNLHEIAEGWIQRSCRTP